MATLTGEPLLAIEPVLYEPDTGLGRYPSTAIEVITSGWDGLDHPGGGGISATGGTTGSVKSSSV